MLILIFGTFAGTKILG